MLRTFVEPIQQTRTNHGIARAGELPLELIRMKAKGCKVKLNDNKLGFTLPSNIGELGDDITTLKLAECSLRGAARPIIPPPHESQSRWKPI